MPQMILQRKDTGKKKNDINALVKNILYGVERWDIRKRNKEHLKVVESTDLLWITTRTKWETFIDKEIKQKMGDRSDFVSGY